VEASIINSGKVMKHDLLGIKNNHAKLVIKDEMHLLVQQMSIFK